MLQDDEPSSTTARADAPPDAVQHLLEAAQVLIVGLDGVGRIQAFNLVAAKLTGYSVTEVTGSSFFDALVSRIRNPDAWAAVAQLQKDGGSVEFEGSLLTKAGTERLVSWRATLRQEEDKVTGILLLGFDITARRGAEATRRTHEERLRYALEATNDGLWDVHLKTGAVYMSPRGCQILEYAPSEQATIAAVWSDLVHPDDLALTQERLNSYLAGHAAVFEVEQRLRTKSGAWKWVLARGKVVERDVRGEPSRMVGTHSDITSRKEAEMKLEESRQRLARLIDTVPDGILILAASGHIEFANPAAERILSLTRSNIEGRSYFDPAWRISALDGAPFPFSDLPFARVRATGLPVYGVEHAIESQAGRRTLLSINAAPLHDAAGCLTDVVVAVTDITERERVHAELARTSRFLREAQQIARLGCFEYVAATQSTLWSDEEFRIYGLDPSGPSPSYEDMLAKCIHPDDRAVLHHAFTAAMQSKSAFELEHRIVHPDGTVRWVFDRAQPSFDKNGNLLRYVGITRDITELKQAETALRESEGRYRSMFENNYAVMLLINPEDGSIADANPAASRFYGWSQEELKRMNISDLNTLSPEQVRAERERARAAQSYHFHFRHRRADASVRDVEIFGGPVTSGGKTLLFSIVHDISERKTAESAVSAQLDELRRWHACTLGREMRILELKAEVNRLLATAGLPARYESAAESGAGASIKS